MAAEPWQCPACEVWIRGDVAEHRCKPEGGGSAVPAVPFGGGGGGGGIATWTAPPGTTITTTSGTTYQASVTGPPSSWIVRAAEGMTPSQIREMQDALNQVAKSAKWQHKVVIVPTGSRAA